MTPDLSFQISSFSRLIYYITDEEDRFLLQLQKLVADTGGLTAKVYNAAFGLVPLATAVGEWEARSHPVDSATVNIHDALISIYRDPRLGGQNIYVLTDPDRWLQDAHVQRRILNILHQAHNNPLRILTIICVSCRRVIPEKLARYTEVVHDRGLAESELTSLVERTCLQLQMKSPPQPETLFKGLTGFEVQSAILQSFRRGQTADPAFLSEYRFRQLRKTDLVHHLDVSKDTFERVGGLGRLKSWAKRTKAAWSKEGRDFGLEPPRGILAIGVWGCGKSLSIKALGNAWGLPVIQLEMGKLRSSAVGESEANVYRALRIIESVAPCMVFVDEAEKSLAGGHSSAYTDAGTTSRTIGILSTWMQETTAPVCIAMSANSVATLPVEFVNRMDERFFFDLPSTADRAEILRIHLARRQQDPERFNMTRLAEAAEYMVGREIEQCVKAAMLVSYERGQKQLDEFIFLDELRRKPRIVNTMVDEINETLEWVGYDPKVNDGVRARFAADPQQQEGNVVCLKR